MCKELANNTLKNELSKAGSHCNAALCDLTRQYGRAATFIYIAEELNGRPYCEINYTGIVKFNDENKVIFRTSCSGSHWKQSLAPYCL